MSARTSRLLAIAGGLLALTFAAAALTLLAVLEADASYNGPDSELSPANLFEIFMTFAFALVGSLITIKRPGNRVGMALQLAGVGVLFGGMLDGYARLALFAKPEAGLPGGVAAAVIAAGSWTPLMAGVFLLVLLFPSGRLPSPRWRPVAALVLVAFVVIWLSISTYPSNLDPPFEAYYNTLAFRDDDDYLLFLFPLIALCLAAIGAAALDLAVRFWRSKGEEREQYKWLAFAAALLAVSLPLSGTSGTISNVADIVFGIGLAGLPVAVAVAVLRYHLYDIDRIINRTLTYGLLTAGLAAVYFGLVVGLQSLLRPVGGGSDLAIVATTLVVAALFLPARRRVQAAVDRRFNRRAYDAARTIDAFSARLREQIDLDTLRYELLAVVDETMQPDAATVWLRTPGPHRGQASRDGEQVRQGA